METKRPTNPAAEEILGLYFQVLDHGFISCVDYSGTDECIERAARVSYGYGTRKTNLTRGLIRYLRRHHHCYDSETEVLTARGFIKWPDVKEDDLLGMWDPNAESLCYEKPEYLTKDFYSGKMYKVSHKKVNLLVTPEHSMYVDTKKWCSVRKNMFWTNNRRLIKAKDLNHSSMVRYFKTAPRHNLTECDHELFMIGKQNKIANLKLFGFFIGDGHAGGTLANGITFHLKKKRKIDFLRHICKEGGFNLNEGKNNQFIVYGKGFRDLFQKHFYRKNTLLPAGHEKVIPECFMDLSQSDALTLIEGLRNSDGSQKRKTFTYSSNSLQLINALQIIGLHAGYAVSINKSQKNTHKAMFMTNPDAVINQGIVNTSWVKYEGYVYCAKTRTGILIVRRNGKVVLSGNTTPSEMVELKFHCCMPIFVARQWIRHRTANVNEFSGRYSLMPMLFYTPPLDQFKTQSKSNNQGRGDNLDIDKYNAAISAWNQSRKHSAKLYEDLTEGDVAREIARIDLPLSVYTQWYWKTDLHNLLHFLTLRVDPHAQWEIREYGKIMAGMLKRVAPLSYEAWIDYDVCGTRFSRMELNILHDILSLQKEKREDNTDIYMIHAESTNFVDDLAKKHNLSKREVSEFIAKLSRRDMPDFELDLSKAKPPEYFEKKMVAAVPNIDKDK